MTQLERLVRAHVEAATMMTFGSTAELVAEKIARELLDDADFRAEMRALIRRAFIDSLEGLTTDVRKRKGVRKGRKYGSGPDSDSGLSPLFR